MFKPQQTLLFLLGVGAICGGLMFLIPEKGIEITDDFTLIVNANSVVASSVVITHFKDNIYKINYSFTSNATFIFGVRKLVSNTVRPIAT